MFNNTAFEVVIGLVFIYILYSLLVTIITELISSVLNQRGKVLKKGIKRMLDDEDAKLFSDDFMKRPEIKYLSSKNRIPSYINASTFSTAMINVLRKASNANDVFNEYLKELEGKSDRTDTEEIIYNLLVEAGGSIDKLKNLLGNWYNETMDRVAGWYKRRIQLITFVIGVVIAFSLNVDTIGIAKKLTGESDARMEMVKMATEYVSQSAPADSTHILVQEEMEKIIDDIHKQESIITMAWPPFDLRTSAFWRYVLGCLITAIALSLGAPFWFDILNKLVKLRGSGKQETIGTEKRVEKENKG
jgi:hypothetical protein